MGPSPLAYPSLVANDLGLTLNLRPTGCSLGGDNLAVSGAPSVVNQWTGKENDCHKKGPVPAHNAVSPNELNAANLTADPPSLVTIQVGADDIDFGGCLAGLLGIPQWVPKVGAVQCVQTVNDQYQVTPRLGTELSSLAKGLTSIVNQVHDQAPEARIALIDYYQIMPQANEALVGTTRICRILRLASKVENERASLIAQAEFIQDELNSTIESVADSESYVQFINIGGLFTGHELCAANPSAPGKSQSWLFDDTWDMAHPNAIGQRQIADAVEGDLG
jgi:lysophospholipase L1-like esterase